LNKTSGQTWGKKKSNELSFGTDLVFGNDLFPRRKKERSVKICKSQKKGGNKTVGSVKPRRNDPPFGLVY
jgi:hypothetical protein